MTWMSSPAATPGPRPGAVLAAVLGVVVLVAFAAARWWDPPHVRDLAARHAAVGPREGAGRAPTPLPRD